jgi:hypothetical protein
MFAIGRIPWARDDELQEHGCFVVSMVVPATRLVQVALQRPTGSDFRTWRQPD